MSSDVAISASIRQNLLSLQNTNSLLDQTTNRLATGREVNNVFDDPINFVASQNLNDQAGDLSRLLDGIGQNIRSIEQAVNGTNAIEGLLDQAQAVTNSAREAIAGGGSQARVTGNVDIRGIEDFSDEDGINTSGGATFSRIEFTLTDPTDSDNPVIDARGNADTTSTGQIARVDFGGTDSDFTDGQPISADELVNAINDINDQLRASNDITEDVIRARLDENGQLQVEALNGGDLEINLISDDGVPTDDAGNLNFAQTLGLGQQANLVQDGSSTTNDLLVTAVSSPTVSSNAFLAETTPGSGEFRTAQASDALSSILISDSTAPSEQVVTASVDSGDELRIGVNGGSTTVDIDLSTGTIQDLVDGINNSSGIGSLIQASFDESTGSIQIRSIDESVETVDITTANSGGSTASLDTRFGFGVQQTQSVTVDAGSVEERIQLASSAGELVELEGQFNSVRTQIDQLVSDAGFRGTNLLNGDVLETVFNADRTSTIETQGAIFTSAGLGLNAADFTSETNIDAFDSDVRSATLEVRNFSANLTNDLNVISTREEFTTSTINTLTAASDDLTLANQEEESARLLALQTRQSLGITSLSLANQAQQGILRLF